MRKTSHFHYWVINKSKPSRPLDWCWLGGGEALSAPAGEPLPSADGPLLSAGGPLPSADLRAASCFCACAQLKRAKTFASWMPMKLYDDHHVTKLCYLLVATKNCCWIMKGMCFLWINYSKTKPCLTLTLIRGPRTQMKNRKTGELLFEPKLNIILRTDSYIFE